VRLGLGFEFGSEAACAVGMFCCMRYFGFGLVLRFFCGGRCARGGASEGRVIGRCCMDRPLVCVRSERLAFVTLFENFLYLSPSRISAC